MKKYKLIKEYPGSPKLGSWAYKTNGGAININGRVHCSTESNYFEKIVTNQPKFWEEKFDHSLMLECIRKFPKGSRVKCAKTGNEYVVASEFTKPVKNDWFEGIYYYGLNKSDILAVKDGCSEGFYLRHNNKFAEKVFKKDYEILSFRGMFILTRNSDGKFDSSSNRNFSEKELLDNQCEIYSVKRLSDGEIFTIGDQSKFGEITGFLLDNYKIFSQTLSCDRSCVLSLLKKIEEPLFTTEDGVNIFESDEYYYTVSAPSFHHISKLSVKKFENGFLKEYPHNKRFSTREAAEEYVLMNKPYLSINDVLSNIPKLSKRLKEELINYTKENKLS